MDVSCRSLVSAGALLLLANAPLSGQAFRGALSLYGGGSWFSDFAPGTAFETRLATGWVGGFQTENWAGRVGLRLNGEFTEREQDIGDGSDFNLYSADLSLLIRLLAPDPERVFAPYIALGGGALHVNSGFGPSLSANYYVDPVTKPIATAALGIDLFARSPVGLRLEIANRMILRSPFGDSATTARIEPVHQAVARLGLQLRSDPLPRERPLLAVAPPPAPQEQEEEQVVEPPPEATQPPREEPAAPDPGAGALETRLDSVSATVEAHEAELARLRERMLEFERALAQQSAAAVPAVAARPIAARLFTVQVGAFRDQGRASELADRMRKTGIPVWVSQAAVNGQTYYRVRLGAVPNLAEARRLARRLRRDHSVSTWVAYIGPSDNVPPDAVPATLAALSGS